jgi:hypothetical protein
MIPKSGSRFSDKIMLNQKQLHPRVMKSWSRARMKRATLVDSALPPCFDPVPSRVRWSEARAAAWLPFRHRAGASDSHSGKGSSCTSGSPCVS